ncbi:hypothetical protein AB0I28_30325 [Phytomonospora sp. NPDC050363]
MSPIPRRAQAVVVKPGLVDLALTRLDPGGLGAGATARKEA